jgi:putative DNA methylase
MPEQAPENSETRSELPIERGFPIERVNEIAEKEGRAKMHYRPIYTMHKWWARRLGCVFRAISLYTLVDNPENVQVYEPGHEGSTLADYGNENGSDSDLDIASLVDCVDMSDPESLWELYPKDVRVKNKKILDPFMGGGTSLVEASRFGAQVVGNDLNPVAWFVTKKELEAGESRVEDLRKAFEQVKNEVANEITEYYKTPCPNDSHDADVMYNFWVKELDCVSCGHRVSLFKDYRVAAGRYENGGKYNVLCPDCGSVFLVDDWKEECCCKDCGSKFTPSNGNASRGEYNCPKCGQKYDIIGGIQEQDGFDTSLYAVEYYCPTCDSKGKDRTVTKGYKPAMEEDLDLYNDAKEELKNRSDLSKYLPNSPIRSGAKTTRSTVDGPDVFEHGYSNWNDIFNSRQLLCLAKIIKSIDGISDKNIREYLLLTLSDSLMFQNTFTIYNLQANKIEGIFRSNSFGAQMDFVENNVWGTKYGRGTFKSTFDKTCNGVKYASSPSERYIKDGSPHETEGFAKPIGEDYEINLGDMRSLNINGEFDAVITDPPYYDNVIYSELSDFFYVWLRILLKEEYEAFEAKDTPRSESIVANPVESKGVDEFESELAEAFSTIKQALKEDGVLAFTYHHSDSESWGELLQSLCEEGFEVTATYPVTADINKLVKGETVSFDIIVIARPLEDTEPTSWNSLRRAIYRTARRTRKKLEENRELSRGDIGVMEMGACFREYSKHHGKVQRDGEIIEAKEVVEEIYGIIQEVSDIGIEEVFLDLLETQDPSFDDVNKLCRGTNATPQDLKDMFLYIKNDGIELGTWDNNKRQAYIQERLNEDDGDRLSDLDKLQFLRYRYQKGQSVQNYIEMWGADDDLQELAARLADVTGDEIYTRVLGNRDVTTY